MAAISSQARNQIATKASQRIGAPIVECPRGGDVRKYASAEERAAKNQKTTVRHFGFTEKVYGLPFSTIPHNTTPPCTVCTATAVMPKRRTVLSRTTRNAKRKKASRSEENSTQQMQASYMYNCRCCYREYHCNSFWPTVASIHLWDAREYS